jgi:flagellin-specific chaperone FliS
MLLLQSCATTNKTAPVTIEDKSAAEAVQTIKQAKKIIADLPTAPKPREKKNLNDLSWQDLDEYITYQNNYITDLNNYVLHCQAIIDILNKNMSE